MPFDAFHLQLITSGLSDFIGGRIDKLSMPYTDVVCIQVRLCGTNKTLTLSSNPNFSGLYLENAKSENKQKPPFLAALKKHLTGGVITSVSQPDFERVIYIGIEAKDELGFKHSRTLVTEAMGRYSNIFLLDGESKILAVLKPPSLDINSKRLILPGKTYTAPDAQDKFDIKDAERLISHLGAFNGGNLASYLLKRLKGFAAPTLNEIIFRELGAVDFEFLSAESAGKLVAAIGRLDGFVPEPCVCGTGGKFDFFAMPLTYCEAVNTPCGTVSDAAAFCAARLFSGDALLSARRELARAVKSALTKEEKKLANLLVKTEQSKNFDTLKLYGDLILANIYRIKKGDTFVDAEDYNEETLPVVRIALDDNLSPQANANRYYTRHTKNKRAYAMASEMAGTAKAQAEYLSGLLDDIVSAENIPDLEAVREEIEAQGIISAKTDGRKRNESVPYEEVIDGYRIFVGKNNIQNDRLTRSASGNDIWMHTQGIQGSHVIIRGANPPQHVILRAAALAAYYSKARKSPNVPVDMTQVKYVKRIPGAAPGKVTYVNQRTIICSN